MSNAAVVAVDVGGTTLKGAVFSAVGEVVSRQTVVTFGVEGSATGGLLALVDDLVRRGEQAGAHVVGIRIASPGLVDSATGVVRFAANLGWASLPLRRLLEDQFRQPVVVENDARAAVVAERAAALPEQLDDVLFLPVGTGVAAAVVVDGVVARGATGAAGEFGHVQAVAGGELCACGQYGCIEAYASGSALLRRYLREGGAARSAADVVARVGVDELAARVWAEAIEALATGVAGLTAVLDPALVILGGGVASAGDSLVVPLREAVSARLGWRAPPLIRLSRLGTHAGLVGAAMLGSAPADPAEFVWNAKDGLAVVRVTVNSDGGARR